LTSKHLFSTDMHSGLSSLATAEGILYFPDLMLSIVSWQEEPLKGSYPTSIP
jgi:predicted membrane protein